MSTNLCPLTSIKMKYLVLVPLCFLVVLQGGYAVRDCYKCEGEACKNETLPSIRCSEDTVGSTTGFLCESRVVGETVTKGCVPNNSESIDDCDGLNEDDDTKTSCYYCDREFCNSAPFSAVSLTAATVLIVAYCTMNIF